MKTKFLCFIVNPTEKLKVHHIDRMWRSAQHGRKTFAGVLLTDRRRHLYASVLYTLFGLSLYRNAANTLNEHVERSRWEKCTENEYTPYRFLIQEKFWRRFLSKRVNTFMFICLCRAENHVVINVLSNKKLILATDVA